MTGTTNNPGHIIIVDDDAGIRNALDSLLRAEGFSVSAFSDPLQFLKTGVPQGPCCLLLDVKLGTVNGLDIQDEINNAQLGIPVIMMTGHGTMPMAVRGMKAGAIDFLAKPFSDEILLHAITEGLNLWQHNKMQEQVACEAKRNFSSLSVREREVMGLAIAGLLNKQIADHLGLSIVSIKIHRASVMKKMKTRSFADLVRLGELLGIRDPSIKRYKA
ncbi:response regulator [Acetobacter suratthaniensis]|uniref:Response regulator transcription factor n=1 Tax=Acetobacter suratthaniensis TaxID=1502841 RepID=A0ABS3LLQ8_9PROT|nr:response regulator [Acetobacter suratthaniensis]MBO1328300.1 response regulator transcription factor [Acetobacter suratthaniensis]MCX2566423.1 response regulator [Acetobacter suratthaniensis]